MSAATETNDEAKIQQIHSKDGELYYRIYGLPTIEDAASIDCDLVDWLTEIVEELVSEEAMDGVEPCVTVENDGIGGYEYWGMKGYDAGTDYILIEGNKGSLSVQVEFDLTQYGEVCEAIAIELARNLSESRSVTNEHTSECGCDEDSPRHRCAPALHTDMHVHMCPTIELNRNKTLKNGKYVWESHIKMYVDLAWCNCGG